MFRLFYFILKITLPYSLRLFYPRLKLVNKPNNLYGRTIYVSNHPASFMDPLVVAALRQPIVFFMTRSDVFKPLIRPILWMAHMLPIYREHDGADTKGKNKETFDKCTRVLSFGRNLLIFGEGFTDDVFIRRLKPVKKGAIRIGFHVLEDLKWQKKIYVAAVGSNYSEPNRMRSDLLISTSERFCLNDYKEDYLSNPNKTIHDLTKKLETMMQAQITHIEHKEHATFHEHIMMLTRRGMSATCSDHSIPLLERWQYSRKLAAWMNQQSIAEGGQLFQLQKELEGYFNLQKRLKIEEALLFEFTKSKSGSKWKNLLFLLTLWPFMLLGVLHCGIFYILVKRFVEKTFKRKVFWGSVKLLMGMITIGLFNIPVIFLFHAYVYPSYWLGFLYYALIGLFGLAAYMWFIHLQRYRLKTQMSKTDLSKLLAKREELVEEIATLVEVA